MSPSRNGNADKPGFYEFFAGAGLVRLGLEPEWRCLWANDIDPRKAEAYVANFGPGEFRLGDIAEVRGSDLPGRAELAWASFPCQDLSLAGPRLGMRGSRSATFWEFVRVLRELAAEGRRPPLAVVENVAGLLKRESLEPVCEALVRLGLRPGALLIDARWFLPQSRPRVFVVAAEEGLLEAAAAQGLIADGPDPASPWTPARLRRAFQALPTEGVRRRRPAQDPPRRAPRAALKASGRPMRPQPPGYHLHERILSRREAPHALRPGRPPGPDPGRPGAALPPEKTASPPL